MQPSRHSDFGTPEQLKKTGRTLLGDKRGEVKKVYVMSVMDVLVDWGIITEIQHSHGKAYWSLMETSFLQLATHLPRTYRDCITESQEGHEAVTMDVMQGVSTEIWLILNKMLIPRYRDALKACCRSETECPAVRIVQAFGENTITSAFEALERFHPLAGRELEGKI